VTWFGKMLQMATLNNPNIEGWFGAKKAPSFKPPGFRHTACEEGGPEEKGGGGRGPEHNAFWSCKRNTHTEYKQFYMTNQEEGGRYFRK